ncbi:MAG: hypothetical protein N3B12_09480, partial [Armatimonadetes bacterium]|nr:hypothetical protein [Armatimonadota bacterium]
QKEQTGDADLTNEGQTGFGDCYGVKRVGSKTLVISEYDPKGNIEAQAMESWPGDSWKRFHYLYFPGPHNGKANILFFDGRVASFSDWTPGRMTFNPASTY